MNGEDKKKETKQPLVSKPRAIASSWKHLDDRFETKSKSGHGSYKSGMSGRSS